MLHAWKLMKKLRRLRNRLLRVRPAPATIAAEPAHD
jgi:hypothetical protein